MEELNDAHYTRSVTELGDTLKVVTSKEIYSRSGIKLVNAGVRIDSSFYERLVKHKLLPPLEQCLAVENGVNSESLAADAKRLLEEQQLACMARALPDDAALLQALKEIPLIAPLAFKLTLAREKRPNLYSHSISVALVSLYLGLRLGMQSRELYTLGAAALFHDVGELHLDPNLFESSRQLMPEEKRQIVVHPKVAHLILQEYPEYPPEVAVAVLEHHERMDGSGYPYGLEGAQISRPGQVLAVAEVVVSKLGVSVFDKALIETILKLNSRRFCIGLTGYLAVLYKNDLSEVAGHAPTADELDQIRERLDKIEQVFDQWINISKYKIKPEPGQLTMPEEPKPSAKMGALFVDKQIADLRHALFGAGLNFQTMHDLMEGVESNPGQALELRALVHETTWRIEEIIAEVRRRWEQHDAKPDQAMRFVKEWMEQAEALLGLK